MREHFVEGNHVPKIFCISYNKIHDFRLFFHFVMFSLWKIVHYNQIDIEYLDYLFETTLFSNALSNI